MRWTDVRRHSPRILPAPSSSKLADVRLAPCRPTVSQVFRCCNPQESQQICGFPCNTLREPAVLQVSQPINCNTSQHLAVAMVLH